MSVEKLVYVKIFTVNYEILVAACDREVLGKVFREGNTVLYVSEEFYKGELVTLTEALDRIREATIANLVGKNIVSKAIEEGLVHPDAVIYVNEVPHAQIVKMI
ncbi:MAG: hypothetical protein B6U75_02650 [Desulfurococcales archaeon ex4484_217_1]|nr:MAG: hypothetical protein B6U75_02650 [Desulfurococcales archaeon ex4484_217_1]